MLHCGLAFAEPPIEEVVVERPEKPWVEEERGSRSPDDSPATGVYVLTRRDIETTPGSLEDVARAAHKLPGVVSDGDLLAGFHVRGGEADEVVFILDRVPLENPFHLAGFNSLFNPDLMKELRFYAGAPPAQVPAATSAVLDVSTFAEGHRGELDGAVDLSAQSARLFLRGPLSERLSFVVAARRTYMEGYLAALEALNVVDQAFVAPEFSELSGRLMWTDGPHRLTVSLTRAGDRLGLRDSEDEALFEFDGAFELRSNLTIASVDHRYQRGHRSLQTTVAYTRDRSFTNRELERDTLSRDTRLHRTFLRSDAVVPFGPNARVRIGADGSRFALHSQGLVQDQRGFPTWAQGGFGAFGFQVADVQPEDRSWVEGSAYLQSEIGAAFGTPPPGGLIVPGLKARAGVRVTASSLSGEVLPSPRAGLSLPLPTGTVPKVTVGLYQKLNRDPFQMAEGYGNPDLRAERARHVVVGVDQGFPLPGRQSGGLARVETYDIRWTDLVVNPDTEEAVASGVTFENAGSGRSAGVDVLLGARGGRANAELAYGILWTHRDNPLNTRFTSRVAPPQDQRHTFNVRGDYAPVPRWRFGAQYAFHSGRPVSEVALLSEEWQSVQLSCLNCARIGPTHSIDVRVDWSRAYRRHKLTVYGEVLNVGNIRSQFLPIHSVEGSEVRTDWFNHLPMRPFLGVRSDF